MPIPKRIFAVWLNDKTGLPPLFERCVASQRLPGYEFRLLGIEDCPKDSRYLNEALAAGRWVKAADYLRVRVVHDEGGIYLDADTEILPGKTLDHLLDCRMFVVKDVVGIFWCNGVFGAEKGHPVLKEWLDTVERNFRGDGDLVYQPGISLFNDVLWGKDFRAFGIAPRPLEEFFPYDHRNGKVTHTPNTLAFHHCAKSWLPNP